MSVLMIREAGDLDSSWAGREVMTGTHIGVLSDVEHHPTNHRTILFMGGKAVDVRSDAPVTFDGLGHFGGAA